jgi:hypothetical protein
MQVLFLGYPYVWVKYMWGHFLPWAAPGGIWLKYALGFAQGGHDHDGFDLYINCVLVCLLLD